MKPALRVGVISDTHNYFDPAIPELFRGVDHILHAGDIGLPGILLALEEIAPVTSVSGNTDDPAFRYPDTAIQEIGGRKFLLHHIVNPLSLTDRLQELIRRQKPDAVVFGHTHKPFCETMDGVLFFNPGYAGKTRFRLERSVAVLELSEVAIRGEFKMLADHPLA